MPEQPDQVTFRATLGHFPSGVTIMTTAHQDRLHGMTVSAFCSVSLEPLLVLCCVEKVTHMHRLVSNSGFYAINFLSEKEEETARFFADDNRLKAPEFRAGDFFVGVTGAPLLPAAIAYVEARVEAAYDGGDHTIFLGRAVALKVQDDRPPLVFYRGGYARLLP
jgi:flavin reductase (DIM6/NTAB) family NADH-FMN oxidoreductase RutF